MSTQVLLHQYRNCSENILTRPPGVRAVLKHVTKDMGWVKYKYTKQRFSKHGNFFELATRNWNLSKKVNPIL